MEYTSEDITVRQPLPLEVFRAIRVEQGFAEPFVGYLRYVRKLTKEYDYKKGDDLDAALLESLRTFFGQADVFISQIIMIENQLQRWLKLTGGRTTRRIVFRLHRDLDDEAMMLMAQHGRIPTYPIPLHMTFNLEPNDERLIGVPDELLVPVPPNILPDILSTIRAIQ